MAEAKKRETQTESNESERVGGWLGFFQVIFILEGISSIGAFFCGLAILTSGADGASAAAAVELLIGGLILAAGFLTLGVFIGLRKKFSRLLSWIVLGVNFLITAVIAITMMTSTITTQSYSTQSQSDDYYGYFESSHTQYVTENLPAPVIMFLLGTIFTSLTENGLIALYFILSKRVRETLVK